MPRLPNDPIKRARKALESCRFGDVQLDELNKKKKDSHEEHLRHYRQSIPIVAEIVPEVDSALDLACERLGIPRDIVHGFVTDNYRINGSSNDMLNNGNAVITVTSAAVEKLGYDELVYLFGHELGHFLFPHEDVVMDASGGISSMEDAISSRHMEIFMDRIGMIACRSARFATSAALKVASGLNSKHIMANIPAYGEEAFKGFKLQPKMSDVFATHPPIYIRIRSLMLFEKSDVYAAALGREGGDPIADINKVIEQDLVSTADHRAYEIMAGCLQELGVHLYAFAKANGVGVQDDQFKVDGVPFDLEMAAAAAGQLQKVQQDKRQEAMQKALFGLAQKSIGCCPRKIIGLAGVYSQRFENTQLKPACEFFVAAWKKCKDQHLTEKSLLH